MPYTYTLTTTIPASAQEIYDAWLDSLAHSAMTAGGEANMSDEIGAEVSAWDGYITGRNLELIPGERIVQSWRTSEFSDDDEDSIITVTLEPVEDDGTLLTLEHSNVPDEHRSYEDNGWYSFYFEPMAAYFAKQAQETGGAKKAAPEAAAGRPRRAAAKRGAKSAGKAKRAKAGRAARRAKASPTRRKSSRSAKTSRRKRTGPAKTTSRKRTGPAKASRRKRTGPAKGKLRMRKGR